MSKIKKIPIFIVVFSILLVPFSLCASAITYIDVDIAEPSFGDNSGYVVLVFENKDTGDYFPIVYSWFGAEQNGSDCSFYFDLSVTDTSVTFLTKSTGTGAFFFFIREYSPFVAYSNGKLENYYTYMTTPGTAWTKTYNFDLGDGNYTLWKIIPRGNFGTITSDTGATTSQDFTVNWADSSNSILNDQLTALLLTVGELQTTNEQLQLIIDSINLITINQTATNEELEEIYTLLADYLKKIWQEQSGATAYIYELYSLIWDWSWTVDGHHEEIISLLEQLIEGTEEFTESSTLSDEQNELNRVEDELLNNEDASDAQESIKVEVNETAMSFIWDFITRFFNANPKLMGLVISILSLGIIALILNR